jgi:outer membrane protein assembly factor BamB
MSTPVVYRDQIYTGSTSGIIRSFDATSGAKLFEGRLGSNAGFVASLVAGGGKVFVRLKTERCMYFNRGLN